MKEIDKILQEYWDSPEGIENQNQMDKACSQIIHTGSVIIFVKNNKISVL